MKQFWKKKSKSFSLADGTDSESWNKDDAKTVYYPKGSSIRDFSTKKSKSFEDSTDSSTAAENKLLDLIYLREWSALMKRLKTAKGMNEASKKDHVEEYPIHHACRRIGCGVPLYIVSALLDAYPDGQRQKNQFGLLPIHLAIGGKNTSIDAISILIQNYPEGLKRHGPKGRLPIHLAASQSNSVDMIKMLLSKYPEGLQQKTYHGDLPIHEAAKCNTSVIALNVLIENFKDGIKVRGKYGRLPIHFAAEKNESVSVIACLIQQFPAGVLELDDEGKTPKQLAHSKRRPLEIVSYLFKAEEAYKAEISALDTINSQQSIMSTSELSKIYNRQLNCGVDNFAKDRQILFDIFKGNNSRKRESIPTISRNYLDSCNKQKIGKGGNGTIYLLKDYVANLVFVVKEYNNVLNAEKEINILSKFQHPYVVQLLAQTPVGDDKHNRFLLLEYMPKGSLAGILDDPDKRRCLSFVRRVTIASNVTAALCYFHNLDDDSNTSSNNNRDNKLFHRDVKSANICLDYDFTAKIIDCGVSKMAAIDATHVTSTSIFSKGSIGYMAPEYAMNPTHYTEKCEVFSLGIVFVELLTGVKTNLNSHFEKYSLRKVPLYPENVDPYIKQEIQNDNSIDSVVKKMCILATRCISFDAKECPTLNEVQIELTEYLNRLQSHLNLKMVQTKTLLSSTQKRPCKVCHDQEGQITSCGRHYICERHFVDYVLKNLDLMSIPCICHDVCPCDYTDDQIFSVSHQLLIKHVEARSRASERAKEASLFPILKQICSDVKDVMDITKATQQKVDNLSACVLKGMLSLAGGRMACPTLFWIVPENSKPRKISNTSVRQWWRDATHKTWLLYFVCAYDRRPVYPPIEIPHAKKWLKMVAPALKLMLLVVQLTIKATTSLAFDLSVVPIGLNDNDQLEGMVEFTNSLLGGETAKLIEQRIAIMEGKRIVPDFIQQFGPEMQGAFEAIAEKAKEDYGWRRYMMQVHSQGGIVWVRRQYEAKYR